MEELGYISTNNLVYFFNPTVQEMLLIYRYKHFKDYDSILRLLFDKDITFNSKEELEDFLQALFIDVDRFMYCGTNSGGSSKPTFDWFTDSDVIYAQMVREYPKLIRSRKDLQLMSWWDFIILFENINDTVSRRQEVREAKPTKDMKGNEKGKLEKAKRRLYISDRLKKD